MVVDLLATGFVLVVAVTSATSLLYSVAVLLGGGGRGEEDALIAQIWLGLMGLSLVHLSGVLW